MNAVLHTALPTVEGLPLVVGCLPALGMTVKERGARAVILRSEATNLRFRMTAKDALK
ncbi:MAG: hypothetical protein WEB59_03365 [Thermoanaerobaculia bacterium]